MQDDDQKNTTQDPAAQYDSAAAISDDKAQDAGAVEKKGTSDDNKEESRVESLESSEEKKDQNNEIATPGELENDNKKQAEKAASDDSGEAEEEQPAGRKAVIADTDDPNAKWYVVHTFAGHENKVLANLKQRVEAEHLENKIFDILVPTQDKIEIRGGKKETVKEKIFPGYILVKMILEDNTWLTVRTTQGVTSFIGAGNKPIPISEAEVASIVKFTTQGAAPTFKDVFMVDDTVKIVDGPFSDFIGKVESVDKEKGRVKVLVSIFGRETPVELDFLQVQKL